jgi:L(+)-tartrate dehydratase alpha subunit
MTLGKQAACLRVVGDRNPDPEIARLEDELKQLGNDIGMGAMGFVGSSMVIDCHVHTFCLASRRACARIHADGRLETRTDPNWFTPYMRREGIEWRQTEPA